MLIRSRKRSILSFLMLLSNPESVERQYVDVIHLKLKIIIKERSSVTFFACHLKKIILEYRWTYNINFDRFLQQIHK